jgi:hypothetical protein
MQLAAAAAPFRRAAHWVDSYSSPRPHTQGDFHEHDLLLSAMHGVDYGFAFMGLQGIGVASLSAVTGTLVAKRTHSDFLACTAGAITGAAVAAGFAATLGWISMPVAIAGGLLIGAMQGGMSGDERARVRDAAANTTLLTAPFLPGTAKIAGALSAATAARIQSKWARAGVALAFGAALGGALGAFGLAAGGPFVAAAVSGVAGAIGSTLGPRMQQMFRNLANDAGRGIGKLLHKTGVVKHPISENSANQIGSLPAQMVQQGGLALVNSGGSPLAAAVAVGMETLEMMEVFRFQKEHHGHQGDAGPAAAQPSIEGHH